MGIRLTDSGLFALCLLVDTAWMAWMRPKMAIENNWPLLYFIALVLYQKTNEELLHPYPIFLGILCAGLIRFEFMSPKWIRFVRWIELVSLSYVMIKLVAYIMYY